MKTIIRILLALTLWFALQQKSLAQVEHNLQIGTNVFGSVLVFPTASTLEVFAFIDPSVSTGDLRFEVASTPADFPITGASWDFTSFRFSKADLIPLDLGGGVVLLYGSIPLTTLTNPNSPLICVAAGLEIPTEGTDVRLGADANCPCVCHGDEESVRKDDHDGHAGRRDCAVDRNEPDDRRGSGNGKLHGRTRSGDFRPTWDRQHKEQGSQSKEHKARDGKYQGHNHHGKCKSDKSHDSDDCESNTDRSDSDESPGCACANTTVIAWAGDIPFGNTGGTYFCIIARTGGDQ